MTSAVPTPPWPPWHACRRLSPIGQVLSLNDGGVQLDPAQWKTTWYKGGSEPGVLTAAYLASTRTGQSYVVTVLAENPSQPINDFAAAPVLVSAVKGRSR